MNRIQERDGTSQSDRVQLPLAAGYFNVDERGLLELIALGRQLAQNLVFRDESDNKAGNWESLFAADELAVMADIASLNTHRLGHLYQRLSACGKLASQGLLIFDMARQIDQWLHRLGGSEHNSATDLAQVIVGTIKARLARELHGVLTLLAELSDEARSDSQVHGVAGHYEFAPVWQIDPGVRGAFEDRRRRRDQVAGEAHYAQRTGIYERRTRQLTTHFASFISTVLQLQDLVSGRLESSLKSGRHEPAFALYVAFVQLFEKAQDRLNKFPRQRLDFYYDKVLDVPFREFKPEHVHLVLEPAAGVNRVTVPVGAIFVAGRDSAGRDVVFRAADELVLMPTRVATLHTSIRARDRLISPETELGLVARSETGAFPDFPAEGRSRPMFGVSKLGTGNIPARFGFYVASAALSLAEGERTIIADIVMTPVPGESTPAFEDTLEKLRGSADDDVFFAQLGRIIGLDLLTREGWLSAGQRAKLIAVVEQRFCPGPPERHLAGVLDTIRPYLQRERLALFHELLRDAFVMRFTAPDGWHETGDFHFEPIESTGESHALGLRLVFSPTASEAAISPFSGDVHGLEFATTLPVIGLRMNPGSSIHVRSLFDHVAVDRVEIRVGVRGLTALDLWNQLGRVEPSAPFLPFGPLPDRDSRLVIGCAEAASKHLVAFNVVLDWGGLPLGEGGFVNQYEHYQNRYDIDTLRVRASVLTHGKWLDEQGDGKALFERVGASNRLNARRRLPISVKRFSPCAPVPDDTALEYSTRSRDGFLRISLDPTPHGFGHAEYPHLLTGVLSANARRRKPQALPNEPYTPQVNRIAVDYVATSIVKADPGQADETDPGRERLLHEHPFGWCDAWSPLEREGCPLLPSHPMEGMLLIGLDGVRPEGKLKLLFHLNDDASESYDPAGIETRWFYLVSNRWQRLPAEYLLSDTTCDLFRSGIVTLQVPADLDRNNTLLPGDRWWFAVGTNKALGSFPSLYSVTTMALRATRVAEADEQEVAEAEQDSGWPGGRGAIWQCSVAGVGRVRQRGMAFGGRPAETSAARKIRIAERLRHKKRALTPWDYEHLLLNQFPNVAKVKCFSNTKVGVDGVAPGHVLIAVVPDVTHKLSSRPSGARFDSLELRKMHRFLEQSCSSFVTLDVRNPALEQVQIHCSVCLESGMASGEALRRINSAISDFISPWKHGGCGVSFGWRIQRKDIEAVLSEFSWVKFVTAFSMLRVIRDGEGYYRLDDTARAGSDFADTILSAEEIASKWRREELRPSVPWSLAVPSRRHCIDIVHESVEVRSSPAGIGKLEIGSTLIMGRQERS